MSDMDSTQGLSERGLFYRIDGPSTLHTVVLIASIGMTTELWDPLIPLLSKSIMVLRYDQRGHGASAAPRAPYTIADLGEDLIALLDELHLETVSLCGISLGGLVAMWVAANDPERIDSLMLACTSAHPNDEAKWIARSRQVREIGIEAIAEQGSKRWFAPPFTAAHPELIDRLKGLVKSTSVDGYAGCCDVLRTADLRNDLARIQCPTLVIAGEFDNGFPLAHAECIRDGIPNSVLKVLENAGHIACVEVPAAFGAEMVGHLSHSVDPAVRRGS